MIWTAKRRISWKTPLGKGNFFFAFVFYMRLQTMRAVQYGKILPQRKLFRIERMARDAYNGSITKEKEIFP